MIDIATLQNLSREARKNLAEARKRGEVPPAVTRRDLRLVIRRKCYECMGGEDSPGVRVDIANCTSGPTSSAPCSLWAHRPHQSRMAGADQNLASTN